MGYGAFYTGRAPIQRRRLLGLYFGVTKRYENRSRAQTRQLYYNFEHRGEPERLACHTREIDAANIGNWTRFCNHHCDPNIRVRYRQVGHVRVIAFIARMVINTNDQLTISYGPGYFQGRQPPMQCHCDVELANGLPHDPDHEDPNDPEYDSDLA
ncbi:hypothetical protein QBC35DRAFT_394198 [Podospora australis]|uniref:SET domain-containing protein n=1 Tax=Podospora australis TaxID=1536484 RepID=A0AAN6WKZ5_9PEZI|nr:hypothetical protein QBC35DRAFT_394198 [Podospora australis]